jgi:RimJ/RimL family protein N-acetyltransferase
MNSIAIANTVSIRRIEFDDLPQFVPFPYSVSITEPHSNLDRLSDLHAESGLWGELAGAVAITENTTKRLVGTCQFYRSAPCIHGFEIGYVVHASVDRGKGYAAQALRLLSDYLFSSRPNIYRHQLIIEVWNTPSWKVAERAGFLREGVLRSCGFGTEDPADCLVYSRTKKDYQRKTSSSNGPGYA